MWTFQRGQGFPWLCEWTKPTLHLCIRRAQIYICTCAQRRVSIMRKRAMPSPIMLLVLASTCLVCRLQLLKGPSQTSEELALKNVNCACIFYGKALRRSSLNFLSLMARLMPLSHLDQPWFCIVCPNIRGNISGGISSADRAPSDKPAPDSSGPSKTVCLRWKVAAAAGYILVDSRRLQRSKSIKQLVCHGAHWLAHSQSKRGTRWEADGTRLLWLQAMIGGMWGQGRRHLWPSHLLRSESGRSLWITCSTFLKKEALNEVKVSLSLAVVTGFQIYLFHKRDSA